MSRAMPRYASLVRVPLPRVLSGAICWEIALARSAAYTVRLRGSRGRLRDSVVPEPCVAGGESGQCPAA